MHLEHSFQSILTDFRIRISRTSSLRDIFYLKKKKLIKKILELIYIFFIKTPH